MPEPKTPRTWYWVTCPDYTAGPHRTPELAEHARDGIDRLGACRFTGRHEVRPGDHDGPRHRMTTPEELNPTPCPPQPPQPSGPSSPAPAR